MSNKSKQDIDDILNSARAAMEAVDLPMEKFIPFQTPPLLFSNPLSNPLKQKLSDLVPPLDASLSSSKKQKLSV
ncbi:MAG TPA: hypothetical protein VGU44_06200 [Gammaproteobacteria bacterium]|nr:hypothetical protein [Gammaproteobacteria bacterium]